MNTEDLRCYWCNKPGAGDEKSGGCIRNGIVFCWQSGLCPTTCTEILEKIDTMVDDFECPVCLETKKALEMPSCNHKVCLDCYKTIYFGKSEYEKPDEYPDLPEWTYEQQLYEDGDTMENEKQNEHDKFLVEKINYSWEEDERKYDELTELRDNLLHERPEWMNATEVINYENKLFKTCSDYIIKKGLYLSRLTIGNQSCPLCRSVIEY
jgi:Zinc finger, C3HC4 type (RING finger)